MFESIAVMLRFVLQLIGASSTADAGAVAVVAAAAALTALAILALAVALTLAPALTIGAARRPRDAVGDPTRVPQSHPDAPGHSRPRAPGVAASAA